MPGSLSEGTSAQLACAVLKVGDAPSQKRFDPSLLAVSQPLRWAIRKLELRRGAVLLQSVFLVQHEERETVVTDPLTSAQS